MELSDGIIIALIGAVAAVLGKVQWNSAKKSNATVDMEASNSRVLSTISSSLEELIEMHKDPNSIFATKEVTNKLDEVMTDIKILKDRGNH